MPAITFLVYFNYLMIYHREYCKSADRSRSKYLPRMWVALSTSRVAGRLLSNGTWHCENRHRGFAWTAAAVTERTPRNEIESVVRGIEKIETAIEPAFQRHFVAAMAFPNKEDPFPNLASRVHLPARKEPGGEGGRRRRRAAPAGTA